MSEMIYIHRGRKVPYADAGGSGEYAWADFVAGETRKFGARFLKSTAAGGVYEEYPNLKSLTVQIGLVDARPTAGSVAYQFGPGASTANNTTAALAFNHNGRALALAINAVAALVTAYGTATVVEVTGGFTVYFAGAEAAVVVTARSNRLAPMTVVRTWAYEVDGEWVHEIRLVQAPMALTSEWGRVLPPAPTMEPVQDGGYDNSGQFPQPEIQRLNMPPEFLGTYQIRRPDNLARTVLLDRSDDPETVVRDAIRAIYGESGITVETFENYALITFGGGLNGENLDLLEVVAMEAPPGDPTFSLNLNRPAVYVALREKAEQAAWLEVRGYVAAANADAEDPGVPEVFFRRAVTLVRDQNFDALASVMDPKWLRPLNPINYVPQGVNNAQVGVAYWANAIGDGVNAVIDIPLGLATEVIASVVVRANESAGAVLIEGVGFTWSALDANTIRLTFDAAPAALGLFAVIAAGIPVTAWVDGLTVTKDQVTGLVPDLEELFGRVYSLEQVLPSTGPGVTQGSTASDVTLLPKLSEVLFLEGDFLGEKGGLDAEKLPVRAPYLLPALHDATVDALPQPLPSPTGNGGKVYQNQTGGAVLVPGGGKVPSQWVPDDGYVGCDGRSLFALERDGATNSYYPLAYDRTLFRMAVGEKQLIVGRTLTVEFALQLQMADAARQRDRFVQAQWVLLMELGTFPADTTPSPVGLNLQNVEWAAAPVFAQPIVLDTLFRSYAFGVRIQRLAGGISLDEQIFGNWSGNNDAAPASANFALRARLARWDTENRESLARGFVYLGLTGGLNADGTVKDEPGRALIS